MARAVLLLLLASGLVLAAAQGSSPAPQYTVDLDLPPQQRWLYPVTDVIHRIGYNESYGAIMGWVDSLVPGIVWDVAEPILEAIGGLLGQYGVEIQGVLAAIQSAYPETNITYGQLVAMNLIYEFTEACTSIVAVNDNGTVVHGRNLDYSTLPLSEISAVVTFTQNGTAIYQGVAMVGYVGLLTGMRVAGGGWAVSIDQREFNGTLQPWYDILYNLQAALQGGQSIGMFLRDMLATTATYEEAVPLLNNTMLIAPVYIIASGVEGNQGIIITRNRDGPDCSMGCAWGDILVNAPSQWFIVETNYDPWLPDPSDDPRRTVATNLLNATGRTNGATLSYLLTVLSTPPVLNNSTKYTALMSAATGEFSAIVRTW